MTGRDLNFAEWTRFEAERIVRMGLLAPEDVRADYMQIQMEAALNKAFAHGRDGLTEQDRPRAMW
jgi:hypothetical protein